MPPKGRDLWLWCFLWAQWTLLTIGVGVGLSYAEYPKGMLLVGVGCLATFLIASTLVTWIVMTDTADQQLHELTDRNITDGHKG